MGNFFNSAYFRKRDISIVQRMSSVRAYMEKILNFVMRGILGTIAMYFINSVLEGMGISLGVGINAATVLTSGILGFPGLLAIYGIGLYRIL